MKVFAKVVFASPNSFSYSVLVQPFPVRTSAVPLLAPALRFAVFLLRKYEDIVWKFYELEPPLTEGIELQIVVDKAVRDLSFSLVDLGATFST